MATRTVRIVMNGVTGRMGYRQHLLRSVLAIRDDGGITLPDGGRLQVEPVLVGRNRAKLAGIARAHDVADFTTDLDAALADESANRVLRRPGDRRTQEDDPHGDRGGKHVYTEKPIAKSVEEGRELAQAADSAGIVNGVVHDKLFLPGLLKLKRS